MSESERQLTSDDDLHAQQEYILAQFRIRNSEASAASIRRFEYAIRWFFVSMGAQSGWGEKSLNSNIARAVSLLNAIVEDDGDIVYSETMRTNLQTFMRTAAIKIGDCEMPERLVIEKLK